MAFTVDTRSRQWIQIAFLVALGALAAASAAWGQINDPISLEDSVVAEAPDQIQQVQSDRVWPPKLISEINIDPRDMAENKPADKSVVLIDSASPQHWFNAAYPYQAFHWAAPNIRYQPLYFEDVALERYGQQLWGPFDLARTGVLFYGDWLALPHNMWKMPPHSCDTPLGFCRPGSPAPVARHHLLYRW